MWHCGWECWPFVGGEGLGIRMGTTKNERRASSTDMMPFAREGLYLALSI